MKSLRKSLNGSGGKDSIRSQISIPLPPVSKPPSAILPPQKVIRALSAYRPQAPQELSFQKGDFFHVLRDVDNQGTWYEAHNPMTGARGLVPRAMFEEFNRNINSSRISQDAPKSSPTSSFISQPSNQPKSQVFYAVVLHDFVAERADELDAKSGDSITIVAQSNREWFVAKPIGRIGRPGLIPVSFVQLQNPSTGKPVGDIDGLIDRGDIPKVEDWKRAVLNYKQNSIALGVIDSPNRDSFSNSVHNPKTNSGFPSPDSATAVQGPSPSNADYANAMVAETPEILPEGILLEADVVSFHYEMEEYWFRIDAIFQPYQEVGQSRLPPAKQLILFRVYNDFYDFQVSLLDTFPREAGRQPPQKRILPYMPGPAEDVDDQLTATRRVELDEYVHNLCDLCRTGHKYILEHQVVREFLALKPGDVENETEARVQEMEVLFGWQRNSPSIDSRSRDGYGHDLRESVERMRVNDDDQRSEGSAYEDEGYAPSPQHRIHDPDLHSDNKRRSNDSTHRLYAHSQGHHKKTDSTASFRGHSPYPSHSRSSSPLHQERNISPYPQRTPDSYYHHVSTPSTSSFRSTQPISSRSRSHSTTNNINSPPISAANPSPAFVKIKIFDRVADDLIAIRVHPRVTHTELMGKVQTRLGGEVSNLRYRDSMTNTFVGLDSNEDLRIWMESTDKHVLYAD